MDEPFLSEISQSQEDKYYMIPLIRGTWRSRLIEIETRMLGTKMWVGRKWGVAVYGHIVSVLEAEKLLELNGGNGCTTVCEMSRKLCPNNYIPKHG